MKGKTIMKLSLKLLLTCFVVTSLALAADTKTLTPKEAITMTKSKLGYANTHEIITLEQSLLAGASDEWRDLYNNLKKLMEPVEKEIEELAGKLEQGKADFEKLQQIANEETLREKYKELLDLNTVLQKRSQELNQFAQERLKAAQDQLKPKILQAFQQVAKEGSYDMIVDGMCVLAAPGADNVTSKVLAIINRDYALEKAKKINSEKMLETSTKA